MRTSTRRLAVLLTCLAGVGATLVPAAFGLGDVLPKGFRLEQVLTGTDRPSGIAIATDGRIFYGERVTGKVRVVAGGQLKTTPFVTLSVASTNAAEGLLDVALHPNFASNGWVYVFYTETGTRANKIVRYTDQSSVGTNATAILTLPTSGDGTRVGGSMVFGKDGKLYVTVGDMATSSNAQNESSLAGKLLRLNDDGTVPADNPVSGSLLYAKGFRSGAGLAANTSVGTIYQTDQGSGGPKEECNAVPEGNTALKNYAWDIGSGKLNNASYVDPLTEHATATATPAGVLSYTKSRYPVPYRNDVFYICQANGHIEDVDVTGAKLDTFGATTAFYDPAKDGDGTVDAACPKKWVDTTLSNDGYIYLTFDANGTTNGIYRIIYDDTRGPREVSPPGASAPLWVNRIDASHVRLFFEEQKRDAFVGTPLAAGQHATKYSIWKGNLPIDVNGDGIPDYSHVVAADTNGTTVNDGDVSYDLLTGAGAEYYLVSAQNANYEGPLGNRSNGTPRPGYTQTDYCVTLGADPFAPNGTKCAPSIFKEKATGNELLLPDKAGVYHSLSEFRDGSSVHLDLGASDCFWCHVQADNEDNIEDKYRARGFQTVLVLEKNLGGANPYLDLATCASGIQAWENEECAPTNSCPYHIVCDRDTNGDGVGDVWQQFNRSTCNGFPQNYYIDHNWVIYDHVCGYDTGADTRVGAKAWPEWCE